MPYCGELDSDANLLKAAESGDQETVKTLLKKGDVKGDLLQDLLMRKIDNHIAALLIGSGAKDTMLLAAGRGDQEAVRKFLDEMEHTPVPVSKAKPQP